VLYGEGISKAGDLLDLATDIGIIDKSGAWYSYRGERLGQGRDQSRDFLKANEPIANDIEERVRLHFGMVPSTAPSAKAPGEPITKSSDKSEAKGDDMKRNKTKANGTATA
jgi:recombination protein RecA